MHRGNAYRKTTGNNNSLYVTVTSNYMQWGSLMRMVILHVSVILSSYSTFEKHIA